MFSGQERLESEAVKSFSRDLFMSTKGTSLSCCGMDQAARNAEFPGPFPPWTSRFPAPPC